MGKITQITRMLLVYHNSSIKLITDLVFSLGQPLAINVERHLVRMIFYSDLANNTKMLIDD